MNITIGTCSECGGPVQIPEYWMGVNPPVPTCGKCGATLAQPYGPVLPMKPAPKLPKDAGELAKKFEDLQKKRGDRSPWTLQHGKPCLHPEHNPPMHMVMEDGHIHRCPACGNEVVIRKPQINCGLMEILDNGFHSSLAWR